MTVVESETRQAQARELHCGGCGYGAMLRAEEPPPCPMCRAEDWQEPPSRERIVGELL